MDVKVEVNVVANLAVLEQRCQAAHVQRIIRHASCSFCKYARQLAQRIIKQHHVTLDTKRTQRWPVQAGLSEVCRPAAPTDE